MKIFWPPLSKAKGFSIKNLAFKYHEKISSSSTHEISDQSLAERNSKSIIKDSNQIKISHIAIKKGHWANRDFSEYREVA